MTLSKFQTNEETTSNIDVYSKYSEDCLEYVSIKDELQVLHDLGVNLNSIDYDAEYF